MVEAPQADDVSVGNEMQSKSYMEGISAAIATINQIPGNVSVTEHNAVIAQLNECLKNQKIARQAALQKKIALVREASLAKQVSKTEQASEVVSMSIEEACQDTEATDQVA
jgi:hypothetical protein